jgi:hypothetical protein
MAVQPKRLTKKVARKTAKAVGRATIKAGKTSGGKALSKRDKKIVMAAARAVGRTVAKGGSKKGLTASEMSKIAQEAASRSINSSVRPKSGGKATKRRARKSGKVLGVAGLR